MRRVGADEKDRREGVNTTKRVRRGVSRRILKVFRVSVCEKGSTGLNVNQPIRTWTIGITTTIWM
jgi:hypothetical protein